MATLQQELGVKTVFLLADEQVKGNLFSFKDFKLMYPLNLEDARNYEENSPYLEDRRNKIGSFEKAYASSMNTAIRDFIRSSFYINGYKVGQNFTSAIFKGYNDANGDHAKDENAGVDNNLTKEQLDDPEVDGFVVVPSTSDELKRFENAGVDNNLTKEQLDDPEVDGFVVVPSTSDELKRFENAGKALITEDESPKKDKLFEKGALFKEDEFSQARRHENFLNRAFEFFFREAGSKDSNVPTDLLLKMLARNMNQNSFTYYPCLLLPFIVSENSKRSYNIDSKSSNQVTISISYLNNLIFSHKINDDFLNSFGIDVTTYRKKGPFVDLKLILVIEDDGNSVLTYKEVKTEISVHKGYTRMSKSYNILSSKHGEVSCDVISVSRAHSLISSFLTDMVLEPLKSIFSRLFS